MSTETHVWEVVNVGDESDGIPETHYGLYSTPEKAQARLNGIIAGDLMHETDPEHREQAERAYRLDMEVRERLIDQEDHQS